MCACVVNPNVHLCSDLNRLNLIETGTNRALDSSFWVFPNSHKREFIWVSSKINRCIETTAAFVGSSLNRRKYHSHGEDNSNCDKSSLIMKDDVKNYRRWTLTKERAIAFLLFLIGLFSFSVLQK